MTVLWDIFFLLILQFFAAVDALYCSKYFLVFMNEWGCVTHIYAVTLYVLVAKNFLGATNVSLLLYEITRILQM